ncbi:PsiF family protein [Ramlibacter monticola]
MIAVGAQATDKKEPTPHQELMTTCNAEALKGQDSNKFVSTCLSDGRKHQNHVMKSCYAAAEHKKVTEREKFMAECLKNWDSSLNLACCMGFMRLSGGPLPSSPSIAVAPSGRDLGGVHDPHSAITGRVPHPTVDLKALECIRNGCWRKW